jgi:D-alanyl-D-alanine carboxypeptidase (penicillin-binding protein 5/6)
VRLRVAGLAGALVSVVATLVLAAPAGATPRPALSASAAILVSPDTGQRLYAYNASRELAIASTTKLMTALVVLEHIHHLGTVFTEPDWYPAAADSQIGLVPGERMTVHDLLLALMLPSADDAAEDLAYNIGHKPGYSIAASVGRFIGMMNAQARALGLHRTHYTTPIGLDTAGNYSSASDLAALAAYDLSHSRYFARIVALPSATLYSGNQTRYVINRNDLVGQYHWINGVKTGHTNDAGYVLVASARRNGLRLISVVLGTSSTYTRDANTLALLDWGYGHFRTVEPIRAGEVMARPSVRYRSGERAKLVAAVSLERVIARTDSVHIRIHAPAELTGPIKRHTHLGTAVVFVGRNVVARIPLLLAQALPAVSPLTVAAQFITQPLAIVAIIVVLGALLALGLQSRQRRRARAGKGRLEAA